MQKLIGSALVAMLLTFVGVGNVWSVTTFTDVVEPKSTTWWGYTYSAPIFLNANHPTYSFTHDIVDEGFNPSLHTITNASINLRFHDDSFTDSDETVDFKFNNSNYGSEEIGLTETIQFVISTQLLQSDGKLNVQLSRLAGDVYFDKSTLTAEVTSTSTPTPTPEPGTWVLMGTGLVGLLGYGWRRKQHQTV